MTTHMTNRNQVLLLASLATVWIGLMTWHFMNAEEPVRVPLTNLTGQATSHREARSEGATGLHLDLDLLAASRSQREATFTTPRNIFAPPHTQGGQVDMAGLPSQIEPTVDPGAPVPSPAGDELGQFRYLGYMEVGPNHGRKSREVALLAKNDELHIVRAGETIEHGIYVKTITPDNVILRETSSRVEQTLPISDVPPPQ
ncbi:MAG: hypothetical protein ACT4OO_13785 [Nitrospiraceae bacterium]